jgi:WD40 repeat protein
VEQGLQSQHLLFVSRDAHALPSPQDGTKVISGGADKAARVYDVNTGQTSQIAQHDAPIKNVRWIDANGQGLVATGSWDKVRPDAQSDEYVS